MSNEQRDGYEKRNSDAGITSASAPVSPIYPPQEQHQAGFYQYPQQGQVDNSAAAAPPAYYEHPRQEQPGYQYPPQTQAQSYQYPPQGQTYPPSQSQFQGYQYQPQTQTQEYQYPQQGQMSPYPPQMSPFPGQDPGYYGYPSYAENHPGGYPYYPPPQEALQGYPAVEPEAPVAPDAVHYKATPEQLEEMKNRLRNKYRANMPFDWLGQIDNQWYSSWMLAQPNFVAFRLGLAVFTYYSWRKFHGEVSGDNWNSMMEILLDSTTMTRFIFVWICLFVIMLATGGMAFISTLQLVLPKEKFAKFTAFRLGLTSSGAWRSWLIFKINSFYDAAPVMSCVPFILHMAPPPFFVNKLALPFWITFALPAMVMMDWFMTKRTRYDSTSVRRYTYICLVLLSIGCLIWSIVHFVIIRKYLAFVNKSYLTADLAPLILFYWGYAVIITVGVDGMFNFCRFKADYLLRNHFNRLSSQDVDEIAGGYGGHYTKKKEELRARIEAEQAAAMEEWRRMFEGAEDYPIAADVQTESTDPEPANTESADPESDNTESANNESASTESANNESGTNESVVVESAENNSTKLFNTADTTDAVDAVESELGESLPKIPEDFDAAEPDSTELQSADLKNETTEIEPNE